MSDLRCSKCGRPISYRSHIMHGGMGPKCAGSKSGKGKRHRAPSSVTRSSSRPSSSTGGGSMGGGSAESRAVYGLHTIWVDPSGSAGGVSYSVNGTVIQAESTVKLIRCVVRDVSALPTDRVGNEIRLVRTWSSFDSMPDSLKQVINPDGELTNG